MSLPAGVLLLDLLGAAHALHRSATLLQLVEEFIDDTLTRTDSGIHGGIQA